MKSEQKISRDRTNRDSDDDDDDDDDSYSIRHWTDVPPGEVCNVPLFIAGST